MFRRCGEVHAAKLQLVVKWNVCSWQALRCKVAQCACSHVKESDERLLLQRIAGFMIFRFPGSFPSKGGTVKIRMKVKWHLSFFLARPTAASDYGSKKSQIGLTWKCPPPWRNVRDIFATSSDIFATRSGICCGHGCSIRATSGSTGQDSVCSSELRAALISMLQVEISQSMYTRHQARWGFPKGWLLQ